MRWGEAPSSDFCTVFSNVLSIVTLYGKSALALTFENFLQGGLLLVHSALCAGTVLVLRTRGPHVRYIVNNYQQLAACYLTLVFYMALASTQKSACPWSQAAPLFLLVSSHWHLCGLRRPKVFCERSGTLPGSLVGRRHARHARQPASTPACWPGTRSCSPPRACTGSGL